jgi:hypothetical protein
MRVQSIELEKLRKLTQNTEENRANVKVFNSFQDEYKAILNDLLNEVASRDEVIQNLTTNINVNEQRHREYRFAFGNVAIAEDKIKKLEQLYVEKAYSCFDHYSRSITSVDRETRKVSLVASRLKEEQISFSKASAMLNDCSKNLEQLVCCFEKFFNKFRNVKEINELVSSYAKNKEDVRKEINRVIYLQELAKFKGKMGQTPPSETLKQGYAESLDKMEHRFKAFVKEKEDEKMNLFSTKALNESISRHTGLKGSVKQLGFSDKEASLQQIGIPKATQPHRVATASKDRSPPSNFIIKKPKNALRSTQTQLKHSATESNLLKKST